MIKYNNKNTIEWEMSNMQAILVSEKWAATIEQRGIIVVRDDYCTCNDAITLLAMFPNLPATLVTPCLTDSRTSSRSGAWWVNNIYILYNDVQYITNNTLKLHKILSY